MSNRKVFFASKYAFSDDAVDALRRTLQQNLQGSAPFIAYDRQDHLFSFEADRKDDKIPLVFFNCMRQCIEQQQRMSALEVPTVTARTGTSIDNAFHIHPINAVLRQPQQENGLVDINGLIDDVAPAQRMQTDLVRYWPSPEGRKDNLVVLVHIMPSISSFTGSNIVEEPDLGRWRIDGANAGGAFDRLQKLSMMIQYLNKPRTNHVLITGHVVGESRFEAQPLIESRSARQRLVIRDTKLNECLSLTTTKLRLYNPITGNVTIPNSFSQDYPVTGAMKSALVWKDARYKQLGVPYENLKVSVKTKAPQSRGESSIASQEMLETESATYDTRDNVVVQRILHWTKGTVGDSNPNEIQPNPPNDKEDMAETTSILPATSTSGSVIAAEKVEKLPISFDDLMKTVSTDPQPELPPKPTMTFDQLMHESNRSTANEGIIQKLPGPSISDAEIEPKTRETISTFKVSNEPHLQAAPRTSSGRHHIAASPVRGRNGAGRGRGQASSQADFDQLLSADPRVKGQGRPSYAQAAARGRGTTRATSRGGRQGFNVHQQTRRNPPLVDTGPSPAPQPPRPFHWESSQLGQRDIFSTETIDEVEHVPVFVAPSRAEDQSSQLPHTLSDAGSSTSLGEFIGPKFSINTEVSRLNIGAMKTAAVERYAQRKENKKMSVPGMETLQDEDEIGTRKVHNTMGQKAPRKAKQMTDAEKKKELEKAWGPMPSTRNGSSDHSRKSKSSHVTSAPAPFAQAIQRIMGETELTRDERISEEELTKHASKIRDCTLLPVFRSLRTFSGQIKFEIQIGQILSEVPQNRWYNHFQTTEQWEKMFAPTHDAFVPKSQFTKAVTTNGADVDFILGVQAQKGLDLFQCQPFERKVEYHFHCQTRANEKFVIRVDEDGAFSLQGAQKPLSVTNLHFAAQIWDACILAAIEPVFITTSLVRQVAKEFVESIFVELSERLNIIYRVPASKEIEVVAVFAKRTTLHHCLSPGREDVGLRITEVQRLKLMTNDAHPNMWLARSGKSDEVLLLENRLHYEFSLLSTAINSMLKTNETITMGDTNEAWDEKSLITHRTMNSLMAVTDMLIRNIDRVGCWNNIETDTRSEHESLKVGSQTGGGSIPKSNRSPTNTNPPPNTISELGPDDSLTVVGVQEGPGTYVDGKGGRMEFW